MKEFDFNDDIGEVIDKSLSAAGLQEEYEKSKDHSWILKVEGTNLRDGLKALSHKQLAIIEALFFEGKCILDICNSYHMSYAQVQHEIKKMSISLKNV